MPSVGKISLLFLFFLSAVFAAVQAKADSRFPLYPSIVPNVNFWEKIYGTYTGDQGVLHDKENLDIIYTVIDLIPKGTPGAGKINKKLIQLARHYYKNILEKFAEGKKPLTGGERRVYALFPKKHSSIFLQASKNIRLQTGLKNHFKAGVVRSGAYMPAIKRIMRVHGLPLELAYLPHVESSFNLRAHSKAAAVGLWQFTKYTGREFMTINSLVDERFDIYVSSNSAARFLKENYRQLGSWPLALTAYNYGRAGMVRAQKKWGSYPRIIANHQTKIFGFASKNFYSEFLAALRVAKRLENDHTLLRDRPWGVATVRLKGYSSVKELCKYFAVSAQEFERLNPALRDPVLEGKRYIPKGFLLRLPATKHIRRLIKTMPKHFFRKSRITDRKKKQKRRKIYRVKKGDTAFSIARKFKISLNALRRANKLNRKAKVRLGERLKIPSSGMKKAAGTSKGDVIILKKKAKNKP